MKDDRADKRLDQLIRAAVEREGAAFDFQQWKREHRAEIDEFSSQVPMTDLPALLKRRSTMRRTIKVAAAAVIFICVCLGLPRLGHQNHSTAAFAEALEQIEKARTITWKVTFYNKATSKDGQRTWIESTTREQAYLAPGLYRDVTLDESGQVHHWTVTDAVNMKEVSVNPAKQTATVRGLATWVKSPQGPFVWVMEELRKQDLQWVGTRATPAGSVNVFRRSFWDESNNQPWSYDFWIDAETKQLVSLQAPGADLFDREADPLCGNPTYDDWHTLEGLCYVQHDIRFDVDLDESLFSLEPLLGYVVESQSRAQVTEADMIEYLGILAEYYDNIFPDQVFPFDVSSDKLNTIGDKPQADRTAAEQRLLETTRRYMLAGLNDMPIAHFIHDHAVEGSFRYLGKGVRLGDADRIVCWYKLEGASTYRAVYGDLSVQDVAPDDLPLPVEP